uniref:CD74 molecule n=1 Tax=Rattus norvegicus TaxID=10116 RepID=A0ABK0MB65_RAT
MDDQRDLISNHEQLPILGQRARAPESNCNRGVLYTSVSVLVALLLAGQATTAYFLYQQQGRLDKLTVTSQNLQLENLRMKLPKSAKPVSPMRMATPLLMRPLSMDNMLQAPVKNVTKYGNMTQDHVMHLLTKSGPVNYPQLKGSFPENLKHLKNSMNGLDWKVFESWMKQWLLFEMSKNSLEEKQPTQTPPKVLTKCQEEVSHIPDVHPGAFRPKCDEVPHTKSRGRHNCSEPLDMEDPSSGLGVTKQDMGQMFL